MCIRPRDCESLGCQHTDPQIGKAPTDVRHTVFQQFPLHFWQIFKKGRIDRIPLYILKVGHLCDNIIQLYRMSFHVCLRQHIRAESDIEQFILHPLQMWQTPLQITGAVILQKCLIPLLPLRLVLVQRISLRIGLIACDKGIEDFSVNLYIPALRLVSERGHSRLLDFPLHGKSVQLLLNSGRNMIRMVAVLLLKPLIFFFLSPPLLKGLTSRHGLLHRLRPPLQYLRNRRDRHSLTPHRQNLRDLLLPDCLYNGRLFRLYRRRILPGIPRRGRGMHLLPCLCPVQCFIRVTHSLPCPFLSCTQIISMRNRLCIRKYLMNQIF